MKSVIAAIVTCIILFGVSLGATYWLVPPEAPPSAEAEGDLFAEQPESEEDLQDVVRMPVSFRPDAAVSVEAVLQMSDSIKETEQDLIKREQEIEKREQQLAMLFEDLKDEQKRITDFNQRIDEKVQLLNQMAADLKGTLDEIDSKKQELEKLTQSAGQDEKARKQQLANTVNNVKNWFSALQPEQAADYLKEFANNGRMEFAASLLQKLPDRQKSKILGVMNDPVLVDQLIQALNTTPRTEQ